MAFPWVFAEGFENGNKGNWSGTTVDSDSKLFFRKSRDVARLTSMDKHAEVPYEGAYAMHIDLSIGTATANVLETTSFVVAADGNISTRFYFLITRDTVMAASDRFVIFELDSAGPVAETCINIFNNAGVIEVGVSETAATTLTSKPISLGEWHCLELVCNVDAGGGNDGTSSFYLDNSLVATLSSLDQGTFTQARMGAIGLDAGTTRGHIFFDAFVADDLRVYPTERFPAFTKWVTYDTHPVLGPGRVHLTAQSTGTDLVINLYDTNDGNASGIATPIRVIKNVSANENVGPFDGIEFHKGLFVDISGTAAQAWIDLDLSVTQSPGAAVMQALSL